ncbi:GNAT family N-acetyltransferase [Fumia xinanensis]|uniref:GNAT family N-acetyltransferase n=1 Tax=Fumia xinanensis TaxID=2763659 RepID=A0A926E6R9_9FIRM|nr:GNAT family N-acetyltransferase [Fumia xinanensis]MBC8560201.1 GNAT family N-acetyltransferase [Fumia xinanensis]
MDITVDLSNATLETLRLTLRPWQESDLSDLYEYASVPGVGEMAGWPHHESIEASRQILTSWLEEKNIFALVYRENGKVIGSLGLHPSWADSDPRYSDLKVKEVGYVLSKDYWGRGLMPEAVTAVIHFCFEQLGLDALTVGHFTENGQSKRVIEKCGFTYVKNGEFYAKLLDKTFEDMNYILLRDEKTTEK